MVSERGSVVILLENLPISRDRRVWREAQALRDVGYRVTAICPRAPGEPAQGEIDGIEIRTFVAPPERSGALGFTWEYAVAWIRMLSLLIATRRKGPISVVQACNPPDIFFVHGLLAKLFGAKFVFDQHDLTPELYETRFGRRGPIHAVLRLCERATYAVADRVVATNDSYRSAAIDRGHLRDDHVVVVRNGPDPVVMQRGTVELERRSGRPHLVAWMGNMGPQDGVDEAVRSIAHLVHGLGRTDCSFVFIGKGEVLDDVKRLAADLEVDDFVTFTGWIPDEEAFAWLSSADVGLSADPPGPLNDKSTMNKTLEYMSFGLPVVAHDLIETRVSAGDAGLYAVRGDAVGLAECLDRLVDDPDRMAELGRIGRQRIEQGLSWPHQRANYVDLIDGVTGNSSRRADLDLTSEASGQPPSNALNGARNVEATTAAE